MARGKAAWEAIRMQNEVSELPGAFMQMYKLKNARWEFRSQ